MTTTYFLNLICGNAFGSKLNPSIPGEYFLGISSAAPNLDGTGVVEPSALAGYARVKLENLTIPIDGVTTNEKAISFEESTSDWGTMTHWVLYDSISGGNLLMYNKLSQSRVVESETIFIVKPESLKLCFKNSPAQN